jgi:uncharacterized protein YbjT (DUF2867 family)
LLALVGIDQSLRNERKDNMSTILVIGATGLLGSDICKQLLADGRPVRALVRNTSDPAKVEKLKSLGAEIFQGDVRDRASLDQACQRVTAVISTVSAMPFSYQAGVNDIQTVDQEGLINLIEAAKANQVSHFVYTSAVRGGRTYKCPLTDAKNEVERRLKESGLTYTILRPGAFMEVWLGPAVGFDAANGKAVIYGTGQNPLSWIAVHDITKFAVASLNHPAAKNTTLELGGPEAISPLDAVRCFEQAYERSFELQFVSVEALKAQEAVATDPMQKTFSVLMQFIADGDAVEMAETSKTFGIQLTSLEDYVRYVLTPA